MGLFNKLFGQKVREADRSLKVDFHSHLLIGIDDGCQNQETSLRCLQMLQQQGVETVITTPHILPGLYPNTPEIILEKHRQLSDLMEQNQMDIQLLAAAEYYVDEFFRKDLSGPELTYLTAPGNHLLIETNYVEKPPFLEEVIFELMLRGYKVVYAHPERYQYLLRDFNQFEKMRDTGVLFQLNMLSLTGHYGAQVKKAAEYLIQRNMADLVGSDIHKPEHAHMLGMLKHEPIFEKLNSAIDNTNQMIVN